MILLMQTLLLNKSSAQCSGGHPGGTTAYDATISFASGITSMLVKFPKFNPEEGMVTCMRFCFTVGGVVDSLSFENTDLDNPHDFSATYGRTDIVTGPGLSGALFSSISKPYHFSLAKADGVPGSGPDFGKVINDTILGSTTCQTVTTESSLSEFYGQANDSVVYNYTITGGVNITSSANASIGIATSGFVRVRFEYCTCPSTVLPLNIREFYINKINAGKAELVWQGFDDPAADYRYEAEVSADGRNFTRVGTVPKNNTAAAYKLPYTASRTGMHYFRIRQVYANGYTRFSDIRHINLESAGLPKFVLFPNPSNGIVGIKFANFVSGYLEIKVFNAQGQTLIAKQVEVENVNSLQVASLQQKGVYWIRVMDVNTKQSSVNQLLIK